MNSRPIISLSGPSGAGKTEIARWLLSIFAKTSLITSYTTREARVSDLPGEYKNGILISEFEKMISRKEFAWHVNVFGNHYGTRSEDIYRAVVNQDVVSIILITPDTIYNLRQHVWSYGGNICSLYVDCKNEDELRRRIIKRDGDGEAMERRIKESRNFREKALGIPGLVWIDNSANDNLRSARIQILDKFIKEGFFTKNSLK